MRGKDGRFKEWKGGGSASASWQGHLVTVGQEFKRQTGRSAKVGDIVRRKRKDGKFHVGAYYYVKTPHGWRRTPWQARPTDAQIEAVIARSRKGRS